MTEFTMHFYYRLMEAVTGQDFFFFGSRSEKNCLKRCNLLIKAIPVCSCVKVIQAHLVWFIYVSENAANQTKSLPETATQASDAGGQLTETAQ